MEITPERPTDLSARFGVSEKLDYFYSTISIHYWVFDSNFFFFFFCGKAIAPMKLTKS